MDGNNNSPRLLDLLRTRIRFLHYSYRTEQAYVFWVKRYIYFHNKKHPREMCEDDIAAFLNYLSIKKNVSASTQNQALNALMFLYKKVLDRELKPLPEFSYAKRPRKLPTVLTVEEVVMLINYMNEPYKTMAKLMYGAGLRLNECLKLRILDVDFNRKELLIRSGKGGKDRVTVLPESAVPGLQNAILKTRAYFKQDLQDGIDYIELPFALNKKYPNAAKELKWRFVFASQNTSIDPRTGNRGRYHIHISTMRKSLNRAVKRAGIMKHVSCHTFRHSFATHMLENGYDIRTVQELLGHKHVNTTMIYTHVLNKGGRGVQSPLDKVNTNT